MGHFTGSSPTAIKIAEALGLSPTDTARIEIHIEPGKPATAKVVTYIRDDSGLHEILRNYDLVERQAEIPVPDVSEVSAEEFWRQARLARSVDQRVWLRFGREDRSFITLPVGIETALFVLRDEPASGWLLSNHPGLVDRIYRAGPEDDGFETRARPFLEHAVRLADIFGAIDPDRS